jgi:orotate phosphoribosyltransferase
LTQRRATEDMAGELLEISLKLGALLYGDFTLSSGAKSGFYFDGRLLTLSPQGANLVARALLPLVREASADAVGGPALAAVPMVTAVAMLSQQDGGQPIPAFVVRQETKDHGTGKLVEGPLPARAKVAIVDDTCSTGGSLLWAIRAAENEGCTVVLVAVILDRNQGGGDKLRQEGYEFRTLLEADAQGHIRPVTGA